MSSVPCPLCNDEIGDIVPHLVAEHSDIFVEGDGRYAVYARLSQTGRRGTIATQIVDDLRYAKEHDLPVTPDDIYNDGRFTSGFDADAHRPEYDELRELIEKGELDGVIIRDDKRLSRNKAELYMLFGTMIRNKVELHVAEDGEIDLDDTEGTVHLFMTSVQNEDKEKEIQRAIDARAEKHERGEPLGVPPTGLQYSDDKTRFVAERDSDGSLSEEAKNVVKAVVAKDNKLMSYTEIDEELGIPRGTMHRLYNKHGDKYRRYADEVQVEVPEPHTSD